MENFIKETLSLFSYPHYTHTYRVRSTIIVVCLFVSQGDKRDQNYVGKILEFFQTIEGEDYFRVQWFFRAEDTVRIFNADGYLF